MPATDDIRQGELRAFFARYATASLARDAETMAASYAPSFIVGGPQGSRSFANDARFLAWLTQVFDFNEQHGMRALEVVAVDAVSLSPVHTLAIVRWGARFDRTGDRLVEFQISYVVEHASDGSKILAYISEADQEAQMRALGLL